jgi:DNA-directed RNA polymerase specialized sigma24 family protein
MKTGSHCDCLVCRLEKSLVAELQEEGSPGDMHAGEDSVFARFGDPLDLVRELHAQDTHSDGGWADRLLLEILTRHRAAPPPSVWQRILLLAFIPTIHRTASQVVALFPSLSRDDASQHSLAAFLEFLHSSELAARHSHLAFTIARKLRRQAFRWAIHESRGDMPEEVESDWRADAENAAEEPLFAEVALDHFLDTCQTMGWLSGEERDVLVQFKLDGATYREMAAQNGHGPAAIKHRIHRLIDRLRRLAQQTEWQRAPEQLELFPDCASAVAHGTTEKIFH